MQWIISQCFLLLLSNWVYYFSSLTCKVTNTMFQKDLRYIVSCKNTTLQEKLLKTATVAIIKQYHKRDVVWLIAWLKHWMNRLSKWFNDSLTGVIYLTACHQLLCKVSVLLECYNRTLGTFSLNQIWGPEQTFRITTYIAQLLMLIFVVTLQSWNSHCRIILQLIIPASVNDKKYWSLLEHTAQCSALVLCCKVHSPILYICLNTERLAVPVERIHSNSIREHRERCGVYIPSNWHHLSYSCAFFPSHSNFGVLCRSLDNGWHAQRRRNAREISVKYY